jgi:hypothetical protein
MMMVMEVVTAPDTSVLYWNHPKELLRITDPHEPEENHGNTCIPMQSPVIYDVTNTRDNTFLRKADNLPWYTVSHTRRQQS